MSGPPASPPNVLDREILMSFGSDAGLRKGTGRLDTVQLLRAIAATMIVLLHAQELVHAQAVSRGVSMTIIQGLPLGAGVDLFFVISGFIIVFASERFFAKPGGTIEFLKRRLTRIVPMYWFALTLRLIILAAMAHAGRGVLPDATAILTSYLFIPHDSLGFGATYPFPIYDLGWTLNYEMFFYALFACVLGLRRTSAGVALVAILLAGVTAAWLRPPSSVPLWFWFQPIVVDFTYGVLLALAYRHGFRLPTILRIAVGFAGIALWTVVHVSWFDATLGPGIYSWPRALIWGAGAGCIVGAAVLGRTEVNNPILRRLSLLGDSSYALYLLHPFVFLLPKALLPAVPLTPWALWPIVLLVTVAAVVVAHAFHARIEGPIVARLQGLPTPFARKVIPNPPLR